MVTLKVSPMVEPVSEQSPVHSHTSLLSKESLVRPSSDCYKQLNYLEWNETKNSMKPEKLSLQLE